MLMPLCGVRSAVAQVVQLPTFESFSVGTTVVVPDRGSIRLGSVDRARYGSSWTGVPGLSRLPGARPLLGDRSTSASVSSSGMTAAATIIDHREWDAALRAVAARRNRVLAEDDPVARKAAFLSEHVGRGRALPAGQAAR